MITFDILFEYDRVQRFINSFRGRPPGAVANDIVFAIRSAKRNQRLMGADDIYRDLVINRHWNHYEPDKTEALHAIEYYIVWEGLSRKEKEIIRQQRTAECIFESGGHGSIARLNSQWEERQDG